MIVDLYLVYSFVKRLATPFKDWAAFKEGIIDEKGNILKSRKDFRTVKERDAFGLFDLMILKLKKLLEKLPGGDTKIGSYAAALWLIKEHDEIMNNGDLIDETYISDKLNEYISIVEEMPANSAGGGAVAGIGVGPDGEPGLTKAQMRKHKNNNKPISRFREYKGNDNGRADEKYK